MEEIESDQSDYIEVSRECQSAEVNVVLKNSFGFGGSNHSIVFTKYK